VKIELVGFPRPLVLPNEMVEVFAGTAIAKVGAGGRPPLPKHVESPGAVREEQNSQQINIPVVSG